MKELEELSDVRSLKRRLNQFHGMATRFRQRFFLRGEILEDTAKLESSMDLTLVLMPLADISQSQADDLVAAAERGSVAEVESMLQLPQDPNLLDSDGRAALVYASYEGHLETVQLLLEAAANKDLADDDDRYTALNSASGEGHVEIVRLLLEAGANKDVADIRGCTALNSASYAGHVATVRLLLKAGAKKDVPDGYGRTALHNASYAGHVEVAHLLLEAGAKKDVVDIFGCTALNSTSRSGHVENVRLLLKAGAKRVLQATTGAQLCTMHPRLVMSRSSTCCWRPVPRQRWKTITGAQL